MSEKTQKRTSGVQRYFVTSHRTSSLRVITPDRLAGREHLVRIVDISVNGVGIESQDVIEPGLACFKEQVSGQKFGVIAWCRQQGDLYRAGISFITLPYDQEQFILNQVQHAHARQPLHDPGEIIASLLEPLKMRNTTASQ